MRIQFVFTLAAVILFSGWYYYSVANPCIVPRAYALGSIDDRFKISASEVTTLALEAEAVWEKAVGRDLFFLHEGGDLMINFVFDERQEQSNRGEVVRRSLDAKETVSAEVTEKYEKLVSEYQLLKTDYQEQVDRYEANLRQFNMTVEKYNQSGGAPPTEFRKLQQTETTLAAREQELEQVAKKLTTLASDINLLSEEGNALIVDYNKGVATYNQSYTGDEEFTQGDYTGDSINIYHYTDKDELRNVLVHEFGHAVGLPHVEGSESFMYYLMDKQPSNPELSVADLEALGQVCRQTDSTSVRLHQLFSSIFIKLHLI